MSPLPNSISSNSTGLAYAEELTLKVLPGGPVWYGLEPNTYAEMGASLTSIARTPITATRQRGKGTITDVDAKAGFNADLTQRNLTRLLQGFFFADALEKPATNDFNTAAIPITSIDATHYLAAAGLGVFITNHLVFAKNMNLANNNGLKKVTAVAAGSLTIGAGLTADAGAQANGTIEAVGYEFGAGDVTLAVAANLVTLASTVADFTTMGFSVGEWIFVGGDIAGSVFALNAPFFARISSIAAHALVFDLTSSVIVADAGAAKTIRIFFGKVLVNAVASGNIKRRTYQLERQLGNDGNGIQSELVIGAVANELTINLPQTSKATVDLSFVGMDVENRDGVTGIKAGTRIASPFEDAFNTSHDLVLSRINVVDLTTPNPTGLYGFADDLKITIKNNVSGNKALAVTGSFDANVGEFDVEGTATAYFQSIAAAKAIRNNADVGLQVIVAKKNAGMAFDIPLLQLGNGLGKVEKDKPIMVDLTTNAAKNANGYTFLMTVWEYLPTIAIPV